MTGKEIRRQLRAVDAKLTWGMLTLAGLVLLLMTLLMVYNIVARTLFDAALDGIVSIVEEALMVAIVYLALAAPIPISLRIFVDRLPSAVTGIVDWITWAVSTVVLLVAGWGAWFRAVDAYDRGERTVGLFSFPLYPFRFVVAVGLLYAALHVAIQGRQWVRGLDIEEVIDAE